MDVGGPERAGGRADPRSCEMMSGVTDCPFCSRIADGFGMSAANREAVAFSDRFPLSDGHALVVPRRHIERLEQLESETWQAVFDLVREVALATTGRTGVDGVNIGVNSGLAAGQTVGHAHVHIVPRSAGDVDDPRGGVRWVLPDKARYWDD